MTNFSATRSKHTQSLWTDLPNEIQENSAKQAHDSAIKEKAAPGLSPAEAARAAARGLANLNLVNRDFLQPAQQTMEAHPDTAMQATRMAIHSIAGDDQFREKFVNLVRKNKHIEVPPRLSRDNLKVVLEELSKKENIGHLKNVKLDLSWSGYAIT